MPFASKLHALPLSSSSPRALAPPPRGTRHLFGSPASNQRFSIYGLDPLGSPNSQEKTRVLMRKLSLRVEAEVNWLIANTEGVKRWENPALPSGYAYLAQFAGHDIVNTSVPFSMASRPESMCANVRRSALNLETLYGDGPTASRFAYAPDSVHDDARVRLRLGRVQRDDRTSDAQCPYRDIARAPRDEPVAAGASRDLSEPLLADSRNDAHAILSQLTSAFSLLHNGIVDQLEQLGPYGRARTLAQSHGLFAEIGRAHV